MHMNTSNTIPVDRTATVAELLDMPHSGLVSLHAKPESGSESGSESESGSCAHLSMLSLWFQHTQLTRLHRRSCEQLLELHLLGAGRGGKLAKVAQLCGVMSYCKPSV